MMYSHTLARLYAAITIAAAVPGVAQAAPAAAAPIPAIGQLERVAAFDGPMPTGVMVAEGNRIFVNFPRWGDDVPCHRARPGHRQGAAPPARGSLHLGRPAVRAARGGPGGAAPCGRWQDGAVPGGVGWHRALAGW